MQQRDKLRLFKAAIAMACLAIGGSSLAQSLGSARPADAASQKDARGQPVTIKPLPEGYSADNPPPAPEVPAKSVFFDQDGVAIEPEEAGIESPPGVSGETERAPSTLKEPDLAPSDETSRKEGLWGRVLRFLD